jgi:uncharacterized membrane protein YccC
VSRSSVNMPYTGTSFPSGIPPHRYSNASQPATSDPSSAQQARSASVVSTPRYEEVAHYRQELEEAKRENELLKQRIRELERLIKGDADGQRGRRGVSAQSNGANMEAETGGNASESNAPQQ